MNTLVAIFVVFIIFIAPFKLLRKLKRDNSSRLTWWGLIVPFIWIGMFYSITTYVPGELKYLELGYVKTPNEQLPDHREFHNALEMAIWRPMLLIDQMYASYKYDSRRKPLTRHYIIWTIKVNSNNTEEFLKNMMKAADYNDWY